MRPRILLKSRLKPLQNSIFEELNSLCLRTRAIFKVTPYFPRPERVWAEVEVYAYAVLAKIIAPFDCLLLSALVEVRQIQALLRRRLTTAGALATFHDWDLHVPAVGTLEGRWR